MPVLLSGITIRNSDRRRSAKRWMNFCICSLEAENDYRGWWYDGEVALAQTVPAKENDKYILHQCAVAIAHLEFYRDFRLGRFHPRRGERDEGNALGNREICRLASSPSSYSSSRFYRAEYEELHSPAVTPFLLFYCEFFFFSYSDNRKFCVKPSRKTAMANQP